MWYIPNQRKGYFRVLNLCALNECHVKISQNSTIDRPYVELAPMDMVRSCSHAIETYTINKRNGIMKK